MKQHESDNGPAFGLIWDLDGTLVDTEQNHYAAWRALLQEHDQDLSYEKFLSTFGLRNDEILRHHLGFEGDDQQIAALGTRKEELFGALLERDGLRMQPGARQLVEHVHRLGGRQAIASSAPPGNIDLMMRLMGLRDCFHAIVSAEEVKRGKPAPDIVLRAAERLDLPPSRLVVLEDAPAGVEAGKAAGCRVIGIATASEGRIGYPLAGDAPTAPDRVSGADLVVRSFEEVLWPREQWEAFLQHQA